MAKDNANANAENLTNEQKKAAGLTESQQAMREYHEGAFQTNDPITGEERDLDQPLQVARLDRGETVEDITGENQNRQDAATADDYDAWTVEELRSEAGDLEVRRADGNDGAPLKADYIDALRKRDRAK